MCLNRTFMELKPLFRIKDIANLVCLNRTFMELKLVISFSVIRKAPS